MQEVQAFYRMRLTLTHAQRVTRLYRTALRTLDSWAVDREIFLTQGGAIRARFDAARELTDRGCVRGGQRGRFCGGTAVAPPAAPAGRRARVLAAIAALTSRAPHHASPAQDD